MAQEKKKEENVLYFFGIIEQTAGKFLEKVLT